MKTIQTRLSFCTLFRPKALRNSVLYKGVQEMPHKIFRNFLHIKKARNEVGFAYTL
jgi:hypothetical protein